MKMPRTLAVFVCAAAGALAVAFAKAIIVSGLRSLPQLRVLVFAACEFGSVAAIVEWAFRDLFSGKLQRAIAEAGRNAKRSEISAAPAREDSGWSDEIIQKARSRPIVFREICPPVGNGLSFYGGTPIGPSNLIWPHSRNKPGNFPLTFVMQWDCRELARADATGLMPSDGVLYLFADLTWGDPFDFEFQHMHGPSDGWCTVSIPPHLPPILGGETAYHILYCSPEISKDGPDVPRLLPKWPFSPIAFVPPSQTPDGFWHEDAATREALLRAQYLGGDVPAPERSDNGIRTFGRPFPAFPHDYAAVRAVASKVLRELHRLPSWLMRDLPQAERDAKFDRWRKEATERYLLAAAHDPGARVAQSESDETWEWIKGMEEILKLSWRSLLELCADASMGLGSEAMSVLPEELTAASARNHILAYAYLHDERPDRSQPNAAETWEARKRAGLLKEVRSVHARSPNRMFGAPSFVQGYVEEYMAEWLLLLELSTHGAIGHYFGDGVLQFMIRPDDLQKRRFEKVELMASSY